MSTYGAWTTRFGLPAFAYSGDQDAIKAATWDPIVEPHTNRHWVMVGNQAIQLHAANTFRIDEDGHGALGAQGDVTVVSHGTVSGAGSVAW